MKLFDFHMHAFPEALAERALGQMRGYAKIPCHTDGTAADTLRKMDDWGVTAGLFLHIATRPGQAAKINDFAASLQSDRIHCFGSVHPLDADAPQEIARAKSLGLKGLKFHFDYQGVFMDDPCMLPIYDTAAQLGLPVALHAGADPISPDIVHARPDMLAGIARRFPALTLVGAHLGSMRRYNQALEYYAGLENLYIDTSMSALYCDPAMFRRVINAVGPHRVLFGSDSPWDTARREYEFLRAANLDCAAMEQICWGNACRLLGL